MSFPKREVSVALAVLFFSALAGSFYARQAQGDLAAARHDASTARELSRAADNRAQLLADQASSSTFRAIVAEHRADSLEKLPARVRYVAVAASAPDTCRSVVQAANAALAQADGVTVSLREAVQERHSAQDSTNTALSLVRGSTRQLEAATTNLERASKPSLLRALLPRPTLGVTAGVDPAGKPHLIAGVGLGWSL